MRRFLNAMIEVKQKFSDILPMVYKIMQENQWMEERRLFFMQDINEAKSENRTPHAMMCKAFPQVASFWHSKGDENHKEEYFSNFPGFVDGKVVFMPEDEEITRDFLEGIAGKIPKPCSFYQTNIALDGIGWYPDSNTIPAIDWQEARLYPDEQFLPGELYTTAFFYHAMFYQSNSVFLAKRFDMKPELRIRIELTEEHPRSQALAIVEKFQEVFGTPKQTYTKIYTISISPWEERNHLLKRTDQMQEWYNQWCESAISRVKEAMERKMDTVKEDTRVPNIKTLQRKFLREQHFLRHDIRPWDGYGWCRQLDHNYWMYMELGITPTEPDDYHFKDNLNNYMRLYCYGDKFHLYDHINMRSFINAPWNIMGKLGLEGYALYLKFFEDEVVPKLAEFFGDTDQAFYQESYEMDLYWQQNLLGG